MNTTMTFTCFISKQFGVLSILLSMIKAYVFMHTIGKIIEEGLVAFITNLFLVFNGSLLNSFSTITKGVTISLNAINVMAGKN